MQSGLAKHLIAGCQGNLGNRSADPLPVAVTTDDHHLGWVARRDDVCRVARQDDLELRAEAYLAAQVPDERVLELRVQMCLGLFDDQRDVEGVIREERVLDA